MNYIVFSNSPTLASIVEQTVIDTFFVDIEILGKHERQGHTSSLISGHNIHDVKLLRPYFKRTALAVRINPLHSGTPDEISQIIRLKADGVMLPMFKQIDEVEILQDNAGDSLFIDLLVETPEALATLDQLPYENVRFIHFGINDLSLAYGFNHLYSTLYHPDFVEACAFLRQKGIPFGIGGVGHVNAKPYSPLLVLSSYLYLGASRTILSRSFLNSCAVHDTFNQEIFNQNLSELSSLVESLMSSSPEDLIENYNLLGDKLGNIS